MNINNLVSFTILTFIILISVIISMFYTGNLNQLIIKEGLETMPTDFPWDYEYLNKKNTELNFNLNQLDSNNIKANQFIQILLNLPVKIPYSKLNIADPNPTFPPYGKGFCASDWYDITDTTNGVRTARTVRMKDGQIFLRGPSSFNDMMDGPTSYNTMLRYANDVEKYVKSRNPNDNITVMANQNAGYPLVGNTVDLVSSNNDRVNNHPNGPDVQIYENKALYCKRFGWSSENNGSAWTQVVYTKPPPQTRYRFNDAEYTAKINEFKTNGLNNYDSVIDSKQINEQFTTIKEGLPSSGPIDPIMYPQGQKPIGILITSLGNGVDGVDNNIIKELKQTGFKVTVEEYNQWIKGLSRTNTNVNNYVESASKFGLDSEDRIYGFYKVIKQILGINVEQNPPPFVIEYAVQFLKNWLNINNMNELNKFSELIDKYNLKSVPGLPIINVIIILKSINVYWTDFDNFFGVWQSHDILTNDVMNITLNALIDQSTFNYKYNGRDPSKLREETKKLNDMINFALYSDVDITTSLKIQNPVNAFNTLKSTLQNLNVNYETYIKYYDKLQKLVGVQINMKTILPNFTKYYNTVAYSDVPGYKLANPVTMTTLFDEFIYKIDPPESSDKYFSICGVDFNAFLTNITNSKITINNIITQRNYGGGPSTGGQSYCDFMRGMTKMGFSTFSSDKNSQMEEPDAFTQFINSISTFVYNVFGGKEGAETMNNTQTSKPASRPAKDVFKSFFGKDDYSTLLQTFEADVNRRGISTHDNVVIFADNCVSLKLYYSDYPELCKIFDDFNGGGTMTADKLIEVISSLGKVGISGIDDIKSLISLISNFGVKFSTNFANFLDNIAIFNRGSNENVDLSAIRKFINDMSDAKLTYATAPGTTSVNNIIAYFVSINIPLRMYYSGSPGIPISITGECEVKKIPANFPSLLVNSLRNYSKKSEKYGNSLYDIRTPSVFNALSLCDRITAMQQAYMLSENMNSYNNAPSIIIPNVILILSFFYENEIDAILNESNVYSDMDKRVLMMQDMAIAMNTQANNFKADNKPHEYKTYISMSNMLKTYPALMFQYLSNDIKSKYASSNYKDYVGCKHTFSKACETDRTINLRTIQPVV
jgi:hypothetical protein